MTSLRNLSLLHRLCGAACAMTLVYCTTTEAGPPADGTKDPSVEAGQEQEAGAPDASLSSPAKPMRYDFDCDSSHATECTEIAQILEEAIDALATAFSDVGGQQLWTDADVTITIDFTERAQPVFSIATNAGAAGYSAVVKLSAPSSLPVGGKSSVGEPFDLDYFRKNVVHELSAVFLDRATRTKAKGFTFFSAPSWFIQGFEEYAALTSSTPHARQVSCEKYLDIVQADPSRVTAGFAVEDTYIDGAMLLAFLHAKFEPAGVHRVLRSEAATFDAAIAAELGHSVDDLYPIWQDWLATATTPCAQ